MTLLVKDKMSPKSVTSGPSREIVGLVTTFSKGQTHAQSNVINTLIVYVDHEIKSLLIVHIKSWSDSGTI